WLRALPKCELHLHLEGTVTPETLVVLSARHDSEPLRLEDVRELYKYKDFAHFLKTFTLVCDRLLTPDDYALVAREMVRDLAGQGVVHAEVYVAWGNIMRWKPDLQVEDVMRALEDAVAGIEDQTGTTPPSILWIADASRQWGSEHVGEVFRLAARLREQVPSVVGVGIGGDEAGGPMEWFHEVYAEAKKAGLRLTAHAGEATGAVQGPNEIRTALKMGVERVGHGLAAQYDQDLMAILARTRVPLEINIMSNVLTGCCLSVQEHPLPMFLDNGILCTINSDDPAMFGSQCLDEYVLIYEKLGLSLEDLRSLARNSVTASFLREEAKRKILADITNH
ncbi:hypothetical protein M406DRAFT_27027, partial [Cryphonectria parasitica EP155]